MIYDDELTLNDRTQMLILKAYLRTVFSMKTASVRKRNRFDEMIAYWKMSFVQINDPDMKRASMNMIFY